MKRIYLFFSIVLVIMLLSGCEKNASDKNGVPAGEGEKVTVDEGKNDGQNKNTKNLNICKEEKVELSNYGDPGTRLKNCFVKYPGEPTRQDKSYYIVEDICGQFTREFVENMLGKKLDKIEPSKLTGLNNCTYYFDEKENVLINLEYLPIENQKKGNEFAGYRVEKNGKIPMDNLVVWQKDNLISTIYLVLDPNKFISLRPISSKTFASSEEFLNFATNLAEAIKGYK